MAQGDISLNAPKVLTVSGLTLDSVLFSVTGQFMAFYFVEAATGVRHEVRVANGACEGFSYAGGTFTDGVARSLPGELTAVMGIVFAANARRLAIQRLVTDGLIVADGTVG